MRTLAHLDLFNRSLVQPRDRQGLRRVVVRSLPGQRARGTILAGAAVIPCALGPAGIVRRKREGDGGTPFGVFRLKQVMIRADRMPQLPTALPRRVLKADEGWCDDTGSRLYNQPIRRPFAESHEPLWREDGLYDCVGVLDYNTDRIRKGRGSAIFLHVAAAGLPPTAGCVALRRADLIRLLRRLGPNTRFVIR